MECKAEPAEKMPRTDSNDDGADNGDVIMDDKDSVKKVTIRKRKVDVDKKKRYYWGLRFFMSPLNLTNCHN